MKALIIYKGKYGATKQYALWLGHELGLQVRSADIINGAQLDPFDTLLIGASVYIGKLQVRKWLRENLEYIRNKRIILFQVAASPPQETEKRSAYNEACIPKEISGNCTYFFLPGRMVKAGLSWKDRFLLKMGAWLTKDPKDKKNMLTDFDNVKKEHLNALINAFQKMAIPQNMDSVSYMSKKP